MARFSCDHCYTTHLQPRAATTKQLHIILYVYCIEISVHDSADQLATTI